MLFFMLVFMLLCSNYAFMLLCSRRVIMLFFMLNYAIMLNYARRLARGGGAASGPPSRRQVAAASAFHMTVHAFRREVPMHARATAGCRG